MDIDGLLCLPLALPFLRLQLRDVTPTEHLVRHRLQTIVIPAGCNVNLKAGGTQQRVLKRMRFRYVAEGATAEQWPRSLLPSPKPLLDDCLAARQDFGGGAAIADQSDHRGGDYTDK